MNLKFNLNKLVELLYIWGLKVFFTRALSYEYNAHAKPAQGPCDNILTNNF
jgi:hypothetical protein